jgi:Tol biopolymer transport system component/imidazolonepropionase-like amidohydrolase
MAVARRTLRFSLIVSASCCIAATSYAQQKSSGTFVRPASSAIRLIDISTREGTWMSLDVSPDGSQMVFDLLGDLYIMPVSGGEARRLTTLPKKQADNAIPRPAAVVAMDGPMVQGQPFDVQPRFSPDGKRIVFISDRDGADNVYTMRADGSDLHQISFGRNMHTSPTWSPDGKWIAARRVSVRPYAPIGSSGPMVMYPAEGGEEKLATKLSAANNVSGLEFSPDGQSLYFASPSDGPGSGFGPGHALQVKRWDRATDRVTELTDNFSAAVRPAITPDGKLLTYATFEDGQMVLRARELSTNRDRIVKRGIELSASLGGTELDQLPGYAFSPDGKFVFLSYGGKIHRVAMADGATTDVPFHVQTTIQVGAADWPVVKPLEGMMPVRMLNWLSFTPDSKLAVFEAVGKIWSVNGNGGAPRRLTSSNIREYAPSVSPDGRWVAYVTWSDSAQGNVFKVPVAGGKPIQLTEHAGDYANPGWSPDGTRIVVMVGDNAELRGLDPTQDTHRSLAWIAATGGTLHTVMSTLSAAGRFGGFETIGAQFNHDGTRLWYVTGDGAQLRSIALDGAGDRGHLVIAHPEAHVPTYISVSPDESRVLFSTGNEEIWMMPMPPLDDSTTTVDARTIKLPGLIEVSAPAGYAPRWINNHELSWVFGDSMFRRDTALAAKPRSATVKLAVAVPSGHGVIAFKGARLITMNGDQVIENGTIVVRDNRIEEVGPAASVVIPAGAKVSDARDKTIIPGMMDLHDHIFHFGGAAIRNWQEQLGKAAAVLSYGVTLSRDPAAAVQSAFSVSELVNSGQMLGPRSYTTGEPLWPFIVEVHNLPEAMKAVAMMKDLGATSIKQYEQPTRYQRQLINEASHRLQIRITAEGALDFKNNITMLIDGFTATEHMWGAFAMYGDVGQLMAKTGFFYTPTIGTSASGSEHWNAVMDPDTMARQQRFILHSAREALRRRVIYAKVAPEWDATYHAAVESAARMVHDGAKVATGSHDVPTPSGLGEHWEIWSYVDGGMTPLEALRSATLTGAEDLGMQDALGSLEKGKLADLVVLYANPLDDIRNTLKIDKVMKNGLLYDSLTLKPLNSEQGPAPIGLSASH